MTKLQAILGSSLFLALAPGSVAGLMPYLLGFWKIDPPLFGMLGIRWAGAILILLCAPLLIDSFARFAWQGLGTPAPISPTKTLVVSGLYRFVRNPMYVAIATILAGELLITGNLAFLPYITIVCFMFYLFVIFYEEPALEKCFGATYKEYCQHVPRWMPRLTPWRTEN